MHYYVVGVNGSGKTSLLKAISAETSIETIHGTTELMRYLNIPGNYEALRNMNQNDVLIRWGETAEHLITKYGNKPFLLDTHILNLTNGNIIRRDGKWIASYDALVLVKAKPATILARVLKDTDKDRALFPEGKNDYQKLELLEHYQNETENLFRELSAKYKLPSLVIENDTKIADGVTTFISSVIYK